MKTKRRTIQACSQIVKRWRSSGMTRVAFCKEEKIHVTTLAGWIKKVDGDFPVSSPKLVPLEIDHSHTTPAVRLEVEYPNGVRLHLAQIPSLEDLSGIVHLYREPCFR